MFSVSLSENDIIEIGEFVTSKILLELVDANTAALTDLLDTRFQTALRSQEIIRGQNDVIRALNTVNEKLKVTNEVLELHLQVATVRAGLEKSDQGVYDSLVLGLRHMREKCNASHSTPKREFEAVARKIDGLVKELDFLRDKAQIDELILKINAITSVPSSVRERKRIEPG